MSSALTGNKVKDSYGDVLQVSNSNNGIDSTMRPVADGLGTDAALSISTLGAQLDTTLTGAGDEGVLTLNYTANKPSPGNPDDIGILINCTDTASYGESDFIRCLRGGNMEFYVRNGSDGYAGVWAKTWNNAGRSYYHLAHNVSSNTWLQMFVNGTGTSNALEAQDVGFLYGPDDNRGLKIFGSVPGSWCYGATVQHALKLGEQGGSHTVDAGLRRSAAGVVQVFNGNISTPSSACLVANGINVGATTAVADGKLSVSSTLNDATGDEYGIDQAWTINKATSGTTVGIHQTITDTASPGQSLFLRGRVGTGGDYRYFITQDGYFLLAGPTKYNIFIVEPEANRVQLDKDSMFGWSGYGGDAAETFQVGFARYSNAVIRTRGASGTDYGGLMFDANDVVYADTVSISDGVTADIFDVTMAAGDMIGGVLSYTITATAGGEYQAHTGMVAFSAVNKSGTITTAINEGVTEAIVATTGSLTDTWTAVDGTGKVTVRLNANSSLTTPTMTVRYQLTLHASNALTKK